MRLLARVFFPIVDPSGYGGDVELQWSTGDLKIRGNSDSECVGGGFPVFDCF